MRRLFTTISLFTLCACSIINPTAEFAEPVDAGPPATDSGRDAAMEGGGRDAGFDASVDAGERDGGNLEDTGPGDAGPLVEDCFRELALGREHSCGIRSDGSLWCWGSNSDGRLGLGDDTECGGTELCRTPIRVGGASDWTAITVGGGHTCGLRTDGSLWCWGLNILGQLGIGVGGPPRAAPAQVGTDLNWSRVVAGGNHTCAIRLDRSLWCWGSNGLAQVGASTCGGGCSSPVRVGSAVNWTDVALGDEHTCGLRADGSLWCWGSNSLGQLGVDTRPSPHESPGQVGVSVDWRELAVGSEHTCGVRTDGSLWCWGSNRSGRLGLGGGAITRFAPERVGTETSWSMVGLGGQHSCGLQVNTLLCWGRNASGELGLGDTSTRFVPARVEGASWSAVALGGEHTAGRRPGETFFWGSNGTGQLGTDGTTPELLPAALLCPSD